LSGDGVGDKFEKSFFTRNVGVDENAIRRQKR
jgi:hypothetical protein